MLSDDKNIGMEISKTNNMILRYCLHSDFKNTVNSATGKNGWIIGYIAEHQDRDVFQRDIEEVFSIRRSTVSNMIKLMEQKGYIRREAVSYDARLKKLVLTPKAQEIYRKVRESIILGENKMRKDISDEELETFFRVLEKVRNNLEEQRGNFE